MGKYLNLRVGEAVGERMKKHAAAMHWSESQFGEYCVAAMCDMIEDPAKRVVPGVVVMLDALRTPEAQKILPVALGGEKLQPRRSRA